MNDVLQMLFELWKWDIHVFSQPWLYYWLLIPAAFFTCFFFVKWSILTAPLWLPITFIISCFRRK